MDGKMQRLIIICGATGSGKTTIQNYLASKYGFERVITHTTRAPRKGEEDKKDYYFESEESFLKNHFVEQVKYAGYQYGSSHEGLKRAFEKSKTATIILDTQGAISYTKIVAAFEMIFWYIEVPSEKQLEMRILNRGQSEEEVKKRLASVEARRDMKIPQNLEPFCEIIENALWKDTKRKIDKLLEFGRDN